MRCRAGQHLMQGHGKCPERCIYAWQKVRETLKERCKSHKVKTDPLPVALSLHHSSVCRWVSQQHRGGGGGGEGIQFNTKNLEEIAWEGVTKVSHTPSLISPARDMSSLHHAECKPSQRARLSQVQFKPPNSISRRALLNTGSLWGQMLQPHGVLAAHRTEVVAATEVWGRTCTLFGGSTFSPCTVMCMSFLAMFCSGLTNQPWLSLDPSSRMARGFLHASGAGNNEISYSGGRGKKFSPHG